MDQRGLPFLRWRRIKWSRGVVTEESIIFSHLGYYLDRDLPEHLSQGDIIVGYQTFAIPDYELREVGLMILNNTCDLKNENIGYISVCPVVKLFDVVGKVLKSYIEDEI